MFTKLLTLSALFVSACCLSIGTVSVQNVTKREVNVGDLFPDWVPFKNKHGDELGEFVEVKKNKVKKRLAPPMNFLLRAVAGPDNEDYYDKGPGGENDAEDYYEKKEWSDVNRPAHSENKKHVDVNHTDISDIDGVVNILTKRPLNPVVEAIYNSKPSKTKERHAVPQQYSEPEPVLVEKVEIVTESTSTTVASISASPTSPRSEPIYEEPKEKQTYNVEKPKEKQKYINNEEENEDYEEESPQKSNKTPEEDKESEARKAKILSSVDELKERHAEEQKELAEKIKGEDMFKDEFGKYQSSDETPDRFSEKSSEELTERPERYRKLRRKKPTTKPDYDEYEDLNKPGGEKYKFNVLKHEPEFTPTESTKRRKLTTKKGRRKDVHLESGKISVFKNPQLFMMYDDSEEATNEPAKQNNSLYRGPMKFSSKYTTITPVSSDERISLIPADSKEGEPTLFFPKPRKNKKKKVKTTTPATDSTVAETVTDNYKQTTAYEVTAPDLISNPTESLTTGTAEAVDTDTTGTDAVSVKTEAVTDAISAPSEHKKEHHKNEDYHREKGGGREHHEEHSEEHEEHGKKAYKEIPIRSEEKTDMDDGKKKSWYITFSGDGHHEDTKTAEGHHDKENHLGKYDDHGGVKKEHEEESGHYGDHHHEEHGKKQAEYEESGKHSKGHSTKGSHDIHKKEEYEKKVEFFEEDGDSGEEEKHGGYNHEKEHSEGGRFKKGNLKAGHHEHSKGESGHYDKGGHHEVTKGHKQSGGHDSHGHHGVKHFQKEGKDGGKKWIFHHGQPAKTANLVVIDRRGDQYYHGPHYYG